jgi:hypothetical protein
LSTKIIDALRDNDDDAALFEFVSLKFVFGLKKNVSAPKM